MTEDSIKTLCFDNYPEAKLALGKMLFPVVICPDNEGKSESKIYAKNYGEATQLLFDAFEQSTRGRIFVTSNAGE